MEGDIDPLRLQSNAMMSHGLMELAAGISA
jgi:hypothetical protein